MLPRPILLPLCLALAAMPSARAANGGQSLLPSPYPQLAQQQDGAEGIEGAEGAESVEGAAQESLDAPLPPILRSDADLPEPVRAMRVSLMEAARSGDMERLRALMQAQTPPPSVSFGDPDDPIEYLLALSGDAEGREILAILLEVLESGYAHVGEGTPDELYVWPYFAEYPLEALSPEQIVELFTLLTAADYEDMKSYGGYTFFRVGIAPDGRWLFFIAGD